MRSSLTRRACPLPFRPSYEFTLSLRLAPFFGALFLVIGFQLPFWPVWLSFKGLGPEEIGIVLSGPIWIKIISTPLIASLADRFGLRRLPLVLLSGGCLAVYLLYFLASGFWQIFGLSLAIGVLISSVTALGNNHTLSFSRSHGIDYARLRLWGSISFIAASLIGGRIFGEGTEPFIPVVIAFSFFLLLLSCLLMPVNPSPRETVEPKGLRRLLSSPGFAIFLLAAGLIQASHAVLYSAGTLQWQAQGLGEGRIGFLWAEGVVVEIILFAVSKNLFRNASPAWLLLLAALFGVLRWGAMGLAPGFLLLIPIQAMHGVTFAAAHLGAMRFVSERVPASLSARAQGLYAAVSQGVIMGGGLFLSGYLTQGFGVHAYFFMALCCLIAGALALFLMRVYPALSIRG